MSTAIVIRTLEEGDLTSVAAVHVAAFPSSALTKLSAEAARRYYEWLLLGPHDVTALGAFVGADLAGFCFGGTFRGAMAGFLHANRLFLVRQVVLRPWLLGNPMVRERMRAASRSLNRFRSRPVPGRVSTSTSGAPCFGILSIAVHPRRQGMGLGRLLMAEAETCARKRGFRAMDLTVDPGNVQGVQFYKRLQWQPVESATAWGGRMIKTLDA
jgi:ribosomal protein S18 acetylase RimI-like enzyme